MDDAMIDRLHLVIFNILFIISSLTVSTLLLANMSGFHLVTKIWGGSMINE
jgi:hypothetical protein